MYEFKNFKKKNLVIKMWYIKIMKDAQIFASNQNKECPISLYSGV